MLVAAGIVACLLLTALSRVSVSLQSKATQQALAAKDVTADILPPPLYLVELRLALGMAVEGTMPPAQAEAERERLTREYRARADYWKANPQDGLNDHLLGPQHEAALKMLAAAPDVTRALALGDRQAAMAALRQVQQHYAAHRAGVDETVKVAGAYAEAAMAEVERLARLEMIAQGIGLLLIAGGLLAFGAWIVRAVWRATGGEPAEAARIAVAVAGGDLTVRVPVRPNDSTSAMAALARMCEQLSQLVGQVRGGSDQIATGAQQIAAGNRDLSERTERQAGHLQDTAAAMSEFGSTVEHTARSAQQATRLAAEAREVATRGAGVVQGVVATMHDISASSRQIAEITSVIDSIAFQTNILALNAAVEAARAGEQGRGFAVVAGEVRSLAQRSAAAAKQINGLIATSVTNVDNGARQVAEAGQAMNDIVERVHQVNQLITEIGDATQQQTQGISTVGSAIGDLDGNTQQNVALVEQSAAAAASLQAQADDLVKLVATFRVAAAY